MKAIAALLFLWGLAFAERVFPIRSPSFDQTLELPLVDWRRISERSAYDVLPKNQVESLHSELPSALYLKFALDDHIDQRARNLPSIYAAYLEVQVLTATARFDVRVQRTRFSDLSDATWDCASDTNPADRISICNLGYEGIMTADDGDESVTVRKNFGGTIRIPATNLGRLNPDQLLLSVDSKSADWNDKLVVNASSIKFVFDFPKAHVVTSFGDWHPDASYRHKDITFLEKKTRFTYYLWEATDPFPGDTCNVVVFVGVPQTIHLGYGQGELVHERCNVYMIEQYCNGYNTCPHGGSIATPWFRGGITTDLLFFNDDGFKFPAGTVYMIGNDQGSALESIVEGYLFLQDEFYRGNRLQYNIFPQYQPVNLVRTGNLYKTLIAGANHYEGWDGLDYATPEKRATGQNTRTFLPYQALFNPDFASFTQGLFHFAACSQLGYTNDTDSSRSCIAAMHFGNGENAYWLGTRTQEQWEATSAYRNLTRDFAFYLNRSDINPTHSSLLPHFGLGIFTPTHLAGTEEYAFHSQWTNRGDGNDLARKQTWSRYPQCIGFENLMQSNPNDQWGVVTVDVNLDAGRGPTPATENVAQQFAIFSAAAGAARLYHRNDTDLPVKRIYISTGLDDATCGGDYLTIKGQCTKFDGSCVCGHGLIGAVGNSNPVTGNVADRVRDLGSIDTSPLWPHSCGHQSMRSCDGFVVQVKQIEKDHARKYLQ